MATQPEPNWKAGTGRDDGGSAPRRPAAPRRGGRRLVVTMVIIIVVAAVLGYFVVDILETATSAMKGR